MVKTNNNIGSTANKYNKIGNIKVTRNIRAIRLENLDTPIVYPQPGVLYYFNVENWPNKSAFYEKIVYSFGSKKFKKNLILFFSSINSKSSLL